MTAALLTGKTALVTGASGGLGLHFAKFLAANGASVILTARRRAALDQACGDIRAAGGSAEALEMDVSNAASVTKAFASLPGPLDILINNAGVTATQRADNLEEAVWDSILDTNLKGAFLVAQSAARGMKAAGGGEARGGAIVNVASILGMRVAGSVSPYAASKAGLIHLTKALALEWARDKIRVNALCPGYLETDLNRDFFASEAGQTLIKRIPQRRLGKPEELDGALLLLCSDAGSYITGSVIAVDGGHLVSSL
jgi:NAD(P)-dependent dehydrogenase (short-subunit alcohol dehydrogenase family)